MKSVFPSTYLTANNQVYKNNTHNHNNHNNHNSHNDNNDNNNHNKNNKNKKNKEKNPKAKSSPHFYRRISSIF